MVPLPETKQSNIRVYGDHTCSNHHKGFLLLQFNQLYVDKFENFSQVCEVTFQMWGEGQN